ncbi:MAG: hypothetical protein J2P14_05440 [Acidothermales bacterium]|nr:hypothetical protein [Acidothermales bacterium]
MSSSATPARPRRPRLSRGLKLAIVLLALLVVLATCVVVGQSGRFSGQSTGGTTSSPPPRASLTSSASPSPENSGPPATPWQRVAWQNGVRRNLIVGLRYPPKPAGTIARADPVRVGIAFVAGLDSTDPSAWKPGVNPLKGYLSAALARQYTPNKGAGNGEDSGASGGGNLPAGATASYEFYCHVVSHAAATVVSVCSYHVTTRSAAGRTIRDDQSVSQRVTAQHGRDGWRVSRIEAAQSGGD